MRQTIFLTMAGCLLFVAVAVFGAAPAAPSNNVVAVADTNMATQYVALGPAQAITSVVATMTDTCNLVIRATGFVWLRQNDKLHLVCSSDSATGVGMGWQSVQNQIHNYDRIRMPFTMIWLDSLESQTDVTDTFYIGGAVAGSTSWEEVLIEDMVVTFEIWDRN